MTDKYLLENHFRDIVEGYSALLAYIMAFSCVYFTDALLLVPAVSLPLSLFFFYYGVKRTAQWYKLRYFQRHLMNQPRYALRADKIPVNKNNLFVGKGFVWDQRHTQRIRDLLLPHNPPFYRPQEELHPRPAV